MSRLLSKLLIPKRFDALIFVLGYLVLGMFLMVHFNERCREKIDAITYEWVWFIYGCVGFAVATAAIAAMAWGRIWWSHFSILAVASTSYFAVPFYDAISEKDVPLTARIAEEVRERRLLPSGANEDLVLELLSQTFFVLMGIAVAVLFGILICRLVPHFMTKMGFTRIQKLSALAGVLLLVAFAVRIAEFFEVDLSIDRMSYGETVFAIFFWIVSFIFAISIPVWCLTANSKWWHKLYASILFLIPALVALVTAFTNLDASNSIAVFAISLLIFLTLVGIGRPYHPRFLKAADGDIESIESQFGISGWSIVIVALILAQALFLKRFDPAALILSKGSWDTARYVTLIEAESKGAIELAVHNEYYASTPILVCAFGPEVDKDFLKHIDTKHFDKLILVNLDPRVNTSWLRSQRKDVLVCDSTLSVSQLEDLESQLKDRLRVHNVNLEENNDAENDESREWWERRLKDQLRLKVQFAKHPS